ncbi:MAG TPA: hypothetical protein VIR32_00080 [Lachnospiraceae bacterium]
MSQAKVDRYKQEKANRKKIIKKEKFLRRLEISIFALVGIFILGWIAYSGYGMIERSKKENQETVAYQLDNQSIDDFLSQLNAEK